MHILALDVKTGQVLWDVVTDDPRQHARLQRRSAGRQRQGHHGRQRLRAGRRDPRHRLLHHRARPGNRQGTVALQHDRAARASPAATPGTTSGRPAVGRLGLESAELRSGSEPVDRRHRFSVSLVVRSSAVPTTRSAAATTATACISIRRWRSIRIPASWCGTTSTCRTIPSTRTTPSSASSSRLMYRGPQAQGGDHRGQAGGASKCWTPQRGRFLYARDPGAQNIFTFNEETGVKKLLPPGPPDGIKRCPSNNGARNYLAGAVQPIDQPLLHLGQRRLHAAKPAR